MADHLGRKRSKIPKDGVPNGCMGGLLHFVDFNHHLHVKKMLAYNKRSGDKKQGERTKSSKLKQDASTPEGIEFVNKNANIANRLLEDEGVFSRNNSGKVLMRSHNSKRRASVSSVSSTSSQLLRTLSIHHLENDEYVEDDADNNENATVRDTQESSSSRNREPEVSDDLPSQRRREPHKINIFPNRLQEKHSVLREKVNNAKETLSKKTGTDVKEIEQDAAVHQSKEFMDMMVLLNNNRELLLKVLKDPSSFVNFLESQQTKAEKALDRSGSFPVSGLSCGQNEETTRIKHKPQKSELPQYRKESFEDGSSSSKQNTIGNGASTAESFESKKNSTIESASMISNSSEIKDNRTASARFKAIKKRIKDVIKDNRKEGHRISMDGVLHKLPYGSKFSKASKKEKQASLERTSTARYEREPSSKIIKRAHSLSESLDKYSRLLESVSSRELKRMPERLKSKKEDSRDSQVARPPKTLGRIFSLPDFASNSFRKDPQFEVFDAVQSLKIPMKVDICDTDESKTGNNIDGPLHEEEFSREEDQSNWLTRTSATVASERFKLKLGDINPEELDSPLYLRKQLELYSSDQLEGSIEDFEALQVLSELDDYYNFFSIPVDPQHETQFNYVRDVLWKSGFGSTDFLRAWYSPNQPVDPSLFEESANTTPEIFLDNQLLFDLISEVILEIYDHSSSCCPWLSRFDTRTRPMPSGYRVLEEVWANVSGHLNAQLELDPALEYVLARDFAKDDGWMELQYDCEDVGLELEDLILDELLDEVVLETGNY
ncbi:LOW QUALITY PROTEIN: protein TRM32-like [Asparagus officinalis]|uniref:LOW QUALITY PROTEIN: protein TRM32-like n=1 Tax=Asparagus officinalis TaxID=4686 RepID=UPI00098E80FC|nr:LOW QUALITY PROTEIN: protein TRM32-like [Asparagus officinalis]